ncbi:MAG: SRPBCC domain-containing protein [Bacteroidetes bacterium]|nr:MAG: SRPBCC domain-containing protein [Bacteroidota bacterium]
MSHDWSTFTLKIPVSSPVQKIYDMWTTRANLEAWFLRKAEFTKPDGTVRESKSSIQANDTYEWMWHGYPDSVAEHGKILAVNGKDHIKFSFGEAGIVSVHISQQEDVSIVELVQSEIPIDEQSKVNYYFGCTQGWTFYLANLKSILGGGIDLRNKNQNLKLD